MLTIYSQNITENAICDTSGAALEAGAAVVKVSSSCGDKDAAITVTTHDPRALLASLSICCAGDLGVHGEQLALQATTRRTSSRRKGVEDISSSSNQNEHATPLGLCQMTGAVLQPEDLVLILPQTSAKTRVVAASPLIVVKLQHSTELLKPLLKAVGRETAVAALAAFPGLAALNELQLAKARAVLKAVAVASDVGGAEGATYGSAAVDAVGHDDDEITRAKRRRVIQPPPLPPPQQRPLAAEGSGAGRSEADEVVAQVARPALPRHSPRLVDAVSGSAVTDCGAAVAALTSAPPHDDCVHKGGSENAVGHMSRRQQEVGSESGLPCSAALAKGSGAATPPMAAREAAVPRVDLDQERRELMERNKRKLMELQLSDMVSGLSAKAKHGAKQGGSGVAGQRQTTSQRGVRNKWKSEPPPPLRTSLRQRGVAADEALAAGIDHETLTGVQLVAGRQAVEAATGRAGSGAAQHATGGDLPFRSDNGEEATDAAFLEQLKASARGPGVTADAATDEAVAAAAAAAATVYSKLDVSGAAFARLGLTPRNVAKVTMEGVTNMAWLPGSERLLMAAADKAGKVSLWDVDGCEDGPAADTDGVLMFSSHSEYVSGMRWLGRDAAVGSCRLITTSYDGSLRALDVGGAGTWLELLASGDPSLREYSALEVTPDGRTAYLGNPHGQLDIIDLRAPVLSPRATTRSAAAAEGPVGALQLCTKKINSLHLEPTEGTLLASSCTDGSVCIWDVRKLGTAAIAAGGDGGQKACKPLSFLRHAKSCQAAYWASDGSQRLLSTSYDNTIRIWAPSCGGGGGHVFAQLLTIPHLNETGRWILPFRAVWNAACDAVLVGNMRRGLDVFDLGRQTALAATAASDAAASLNDADKPLGGQAVATAKGKKKKTPGVVTSTISGGGDDLSGDKGQQQEQKPQQHHKLLYTLTSEYMTAIPSRVACHPTLPVVVAATNSGRCHVWR